MTVTCVLNTRRTDCGINYKKPLWRATFHTLLFHREEGTEGSSSVEVRSANGTGRFDICTSNLEISLLSGFFLFNKFGRQTEAHLFFAGYQLFDGGAPLGKPGHNLIYQQLGR